MSPETHLLASWMVATKATRNRRDCRLVTLAGILPDVDGLGLIPDMINRLLGRRETFYYQHYHHVLLHGIFGAVLIAGVLALFGRDKGRVALWAFLLVHLHLLCDFVGARGPSRDDIWPIYYLAPFTTHLLAFFFKYQWRLDGWQNRIITLALFGWALWIPPRLGHSVVGVFNRRADEVFVAVLRKWRQALNPAVETIARPPWRTVVPGVTLLAAVFGGYFAWQPGLDVRTGRDDLRRNGIWLGHAWLAADEWFAGNRRVDGMKYFRDPAQIRVLADRLKQHHIKDVFPHLCPAEPDGRLPAVDGAQVDRFLAEFDGFRVMPWIGGPSGPRVRYHLPRWRSAFIASVTNLLSAHPGLAGVQLNVEPMENGDADFLLLLEELHRAMPRGKLLSVAAYPPPTHWHPYPAVHWDEHYFKEVSRRCDQIVVMMYDTALQHSKLYQDLMAEWTAETLLWSERRPVLLGIPTYNDAGSGYHFPEVENITNALLGIHRALAEDEVPPNYQGVAIYCEWETDPGEWDYFREHFLRQP
jgi:hypothetical protein